jgi:glycosyltransferase involved in cell wall biosynthesis
LNKLKICRITSAFPPPWEGLGPGPYELSLAQAKLGHHIIVITKYAIGYETLDRQAPFKVYRIKAKRNLIFSFLAAIKFITLHLRERYDIIHNHGESAVILLLLKRLFFLKVPVVTSVHIVRKAQYKIFQKADIYKIPRECLGKEAIDTLPLIKANRRSLLMEKLYIKLSDKLAVVSEGLREDIKKEYGFSNKTFVILNGVNIDRFHIMNGDIRKHTRTEDDLDCKYFVLFAGVLNGRKGEFDLIKAIGKITDDYSNIKMLIIGNGPTKLIAKKMVQTLGIEGNIKFLSNVTYHKMNKYYNACKVLVMPSVSEGMPKVVLEAMACGCPIIVSDIPGCNELVKNGRNGFLVPTGRPDILAEIITSFYKKPCLTREMGYESRKIVEQNYTWDIVAQRVEECYLSILK